jgi:hypothetical protein
MFSYLLLSSLFAISPLLIGDEIDDSATAYDDVIDTQEIVFDPEEEETLFPEEELED